MKINPMETAPFEHEDFDEAPSNIFVHKGAWATIIGTNDKLAGWVDTHELFAAHLYRDQILTKQYTNTREPGEFGDGVTVEREDDSVVAKNATTASADKLEVAGYVKEGGYRASGFEYISERSIDVLCVPLVRHSDAIRIITACQKEVERLRAASIASGNALYEARVRNAELVKALKPFTQTALVSDQYPDDYEVELTINVHGGPYEDQLTLEDFRRACAALKGQSND